MNAIQLTFCVTALFAVADAAAGTVPAHFRAYVDGHSRLIVSPDYVQWDHDSATQPGRWGDGQPTTVNTFAWTPVWPPGGLADPALSSRLAVATIFLGVPSVQKIEGRGTITIIQAPSSANGHTLIVDIDDPAPGPAWYEFNLINTDLTVLPAVSIRTSEVEITWNSEAGKTYRIDYATTLQGGSWMPLATSIAGTGGRLSFKDSVIEGAARFYRVVPQ